MGKIVKANQPCINDDCSSSDGRQVYEDGSSFCFVCQKYFKKGTTVVEKETPAPVKNNYVKGPTTAEEVKQFPVQAIGRGIDKAVCEFYDVRVGFGSDGKINEHYYPYEGDAYKVRKIPKAFYSIGKCKTLFGKERFQGGGKRVVITEGEVDTLSVAQAYMKKYGKIYPVVSLPSAKAFADVAILANREWLRSFGEVVLCLDNDEAGNEVLAKAIKIIGVDKVKVCKLPVKDANKMLTVHGPDELLTKIWDAERFIPSGVIDKDKLWAALEEYNSLPSVPYPDCLGGLNEKLKGMREGEISLFISGTGAGKSTMQREIMLHILQTTDAKIGIVSLEEAPAETARKLSGMQLLRNPADEEIPLPELKVGFDAVFGSDRVLLLDHQGSMNDDSITEKLEYMCLMGCKYLFIDHITILVSEGTEGLSGNEAIDKIMNTMQRIVKRHPTWIGLISHLRKAPVGGKSFEEGKLPSVDDIKGSGSIKQISFDIVSFARDMTADDDMTRNTIKMRVLKCRHTGLTGTVRGAYYNYKTGRLVAASSSPEEDFQPM
jgi:twinkle protein